MRKTGMVGALAWALLTLQTAGCGTPAAAGTPATTRTAGQARPAEIQAVRYDVTFDESTAARGHIHVEMSFDVDDAAPVLLSIPAWTPGSYEIDNFARNVTNEEVTLNGQEIDWDKADYDTWRVHPTGPGRLSFAFDYLADALDVGSSWATDDFAFFNGTNLFPFPDLPLDFPSEVVVHTEEGWEVATGLTSGGEPRTYTAETYDELVDMPTMIGSFEQDSTMIGGKWYRLATYPSGTMSGAERQAFWEQIEAMMPPMADVWGEVPWDDYTTLLVFDAGFGGGAALEHSNSHLGIYHPQFIGSPILASITAHEIFHAWNVKRLRPADLWPYVYHEEMPTELLWVSEGITDYYADLALVRGGIVPPDLFYLFTQSKIENVANVPPVALEDASLSTWIQPRDGTAMIYYDKGSLAGLMLDILIRDASDNRTSLDTVMRAMYRRAYLEGEGFTEAGWWEETMAAANGRSFDAFHDLYVDGREPYPWEQVLPLAGLMLETRTTPTPRVGVTTTGGPEGIEVVEVTPEGAAAEAGVREGDIVRRIADIPVEDNTFGEIFRERLGARPAGTPYEIVVERDGQEVVLDAELEFVDVTTTTLREDPDAGERARRIRQGILTGATASP